MTGRVTSFHVAELAGASQPTVFTALRDHSDVSVDARARIQEAARRLGCRLDRRAASLRGGSTRRIAVVVLSAQGGDAATPNPFYMALPAHVAAAASRRGFDVLVSFRREASSFYAGCQQDGEADGIVVIGTARNPTGWRFFADARGSGANVVGWGGPADILPTVCCDNPAGAVASDGEGLAALVVLDLHKRLHVVGEVEMAVLTEYPGWKADVLVLDRGNQLEGGFEPKVTAMA